MPDAQQLSQIKGIYLDIPSYDLQNLMENAGTTPLQKKKLADNMVPLEYATKYNKIIESCETDDTFTLHKEYYETCSTT